MIGKRRRERRRQARAAIERYEQQARAAAHMHEGDVKERDKALAEARQERLASKGLRQRLDDANAELRRWGLEPIHRDSAESVENPQRYRRHSDWRTTRSGAELEELLARSVECSPPDVEVTITADTSTFDAEVEASREALRRLEPQSNADLVAQIRAALQAARWAIITEHAYDGAEITQQISDALARMDPDDPMCIVSGALHSGLAAALAATGTELHALRVERDALYLEGVDARDLYISCMEEYRSVDAGRQAALANVAELEAQLAGNTRMREAESEIARLRGALDYADARIAELEGQLGEAQHRIGDLQGDLGVARGGLKSEADGLRESLELSKAAHAETRAELAGQSAELLALREELAASRESDATGDGVIADVSVELDEALTALEAARVELRAWQATGGPAAVRLAAELAEERTAREQAERSLDRTTAATLDLNRWREKERDILATFVAALTDAAVRNSLHADLVAPYLAAAALLEDPDA